MDRLARHLKTIAIETKIQEGAKEEEEEEDKPEEETAESWLRRHLTDSVSCDQHAIDALLGDAAPLIHLITSTEMCRVLFVTVKKNKVYNKDGLFAEKLPTAHFDVEKTENESGNKIDKPRRPSQKKKKEVTEKKIPIRQTISRSRSRSKSKSPGKKTKKGTKEVAKDEVKPKQKEKNKAKKIDEQQLEKDRVLAARIAQAQLERETMLAIPMVAETVLDWHVDKSIPRSDQFLFIINKATIHEYDTHLDELFYIGYLNNNRFFKTALETAKSILDKRLTFEMSLDILLSFYSVEERKSRRELVLENFVVDCVIRHFCVESRMRADNAESRSVQALLEPVVAKYCSDPEAYDRNCLLIQLSSFNIDLLNENTVLDQCAVRLSMALGSLRILNFLYSETVLEWSRKIFILVTDVYSTLLAKHVARKCRILLDFDKSKIHPVCSTFTETVQAIRTLSRLLFDSVDDQVPVDKLVSAFNVVVVLEDDIDEILQKVADLHCEKRDRAIERTGIREAHAILRELNEYLEENCMESAIESSNLESLRQLATDLSSFEKKLDGVMAALPE